jgi:hypothetical protein
MVDMKIQKVTMHSWGGVGTTIDTTVVVHFFPLDSDRMAVIAMAAGPKAAPFCDNFIKRIKMVEIIDQPT